MSEAYVVASIAIFSKNDPALKGTNFPLDRGRPLAQVKSSNCVYIHCNCLKYTLLSPKTLNGTDCYYYY